MSARPTLNHVSKDLRPIAKRALDAGWQLQFVGHARSAYGVELVNPDGTRRVNVSGNDHRLVTQARSRLRQAGIHP